MKLKIIAYNLNEYIQKVNSFAQILIDTHTAIEKEAAILGLKEMGGSMVMEVLYDAYFGRFNNTSEIKKLALDSVLSMILTSNDIVEMAKTLLEMNGLPRTDGRAYWRRELSPQQSLIILALLTRYAKDDREREKILLITNQHNELYAKYLLKIEASEKKILQVEAETLEFCNKLGIKSHKIGFFAIVHGTLGCFLSDISERIEFHDLDIFKDAVLRSKRELASWVEKEKDLDDEGEIFLYRTLYLLRKTDRTLAYYWNPDNDTELQNSTSRLLKTIMLVKLTIPADHEKEYSLLMRHLQKDYPEESLNNSEYQQLSEYLQSINKNILDYTPENINALLNEFD